MTLMVDLPEDVLAALGAEPQREVLESVVLHLVTQGKLPVARAGELLGMDRLSAIRWYAAREEAYSNLDDEDLDLLIDDIKKRNAALDADIMEAIDEAVSKA
jgi:predicted HTH domain antitoxin